MSFYSCLDVFSDGYKDFLNAINPPVCESLEVVIREYDEFIKSINPRISERVEVVTDAYDEFFDSLTPPFSEKPTRDTINGQDTLGNTFLHIAFFRKRYDVMEMLVKEENINLNVFNSTHRTPLLEAALFADEVAVRILLEHGADTDVQDNDGFTALHYCIFHREHRLCHILLEAGASPDVPNSFGKTAFLTALEEENNEIIKMMMCFGADPHLYDMRGTTPFEHVCCRYSVDIEAKDEFLYCFDHMEKLVPFNILITTLICNSELFGMIVVKAHQTLVSEWGLIQFVKNLSRIKVSDIEILFNHFPGLIDGMVDLFGFEIFEQLLTCSYPNKGRKNMGILRLYSFFLEDKVVKRLINSQHKQKPILHLFASIFFELKLSIELLCKNLMRLVMLGVKVYEYDVCVIYICFGHNALFEMLLHMQVPMPEDYLNLLVNSEFQLPMMPGMICCPRLTVKMCEEFPETFLKSIEVPYYFAVPKFVKYVEEKSEKDVKAFNRESVKKLPQVKMPSLLQLARDKFREHFVEKLNITNGMEFAMNLKQLDISDHYKNIISLKKKIYHPSSS